MQFSGDQLVNPGNTVGQSVRLFEPPKSCFPCKGRGLYGRGFRLAGVKEHIEVHPHTKFHGDWPVNSGNIQDQRFVSPKFWAPAVGVGC